MRPQLRLTLLLALMVIAFTVIGTLSHELGHAAVGWSLGLKPKVHYAYTEYAGRPDDPRLMEMAIKYAGPIRAGQPFPGDTLYYRLEREAHRKMALSTWGGPAQTMLTGSIGLFILVIHWRRFRARMALSAGQWMIVFVTLFWLRQPANFLAASAQWLISGNFPRSSDEATLSYYHGMPLWALGLFTSILATGVCLVVIRAIPRRQRGSFLLAFAIGAPLGFGIWLFFLGPALMP